MFESDETGEYSLYSVGPSRDTKSWKLCVKDDVKTPFTATITITGEEKDEIGSIGLWMEASDEELDPSAMTLDEVQDRWMIELEVYVESTSTITSVMQQIKLQDSID